MTNYDWTRLNPLQLGRYAEYYAKMEFASYGFEIYTSEVDDHGIDFVAKKSNNRYFDVQVKSIRGYNYIFFPKDKFNLRNNLYAAIVIFLPTESPHFYLIPSINWQGPNALLVSRDYIGKKSEPEWGLNLSKKNLDLLYQYSFDKSILELLKDEE
jgi:hypothetical protein